MKKVVKINYLQKIPERNETINWTSDENGIVTLEVLNKGIINKIFQRLLKKPKISFIHLDETGSFVWPLIDGKKTVEEIGKELERNFGERANPVFERLVKYFEILKSYGFVGFKY